MSRASFLAFLLALACTPNPSPLLLLAPAHTRPALQRLVGDWADMAAAPTRVVYVETDETAHLVETGAAADVVVGPQAALQQLGKRGHLRAGTQQSLIGDHLAVVRHAQTPGPRLHAAEDLSQLDSLFVSPAGTVVGAASLDLLADVDVALQPLGSPDEALQRLVSTRTGHALVEVSRALDLPEVQTTLVLTGPSSRPVLLYGVGVTTHAEQPEPARELAAHLASDLALAAFLRVGFVRGPTSRAAGRGARGAPSPPRRDPEPQPAAK